MAVLTLLSSTALAQPQPPAPICVLAAGPTPDPAGVLGALSAGADPNTTCPVTRTVRRTLSFPEVLFGALIPPLGVMLVLDPGTTSRVEHVPLLTLAVGQQAKPLASALLAAGADPLHGSPGRNMPLVAAIEADLTAQATEWTDHLLDGRSIPADLLCRNTALLDRLWTAPGLTLRLEAAGLPPGGQDCAGGTWLHRAAAAGDLDRVQALVASAEVPLDQPDHDGRHPIHHAATRRHWDMVETLAGHGAVLTGAGGRRGSLLHEAIRQGQTDWVARLLDHGLVATSVDATGQSLLAAAAQSRNHEALRLLIGAGADPTADPGLLEEAVRSRSVQSVSLLLAAGSSPDTPASFGRDLFDLAYAQDALDVAHALVAAGGVPGRGREAGSIHRRPPLLVEAFRGDRSAWTRLLLPAVSDTARTDVLVSLLLRERYADAELVLTHPCQPSEALARLATFGNPSQVRWLQDRGIRYAPDALLTLVPFAPLAEVVRALEQGASPHGAADPADPGHGLPMERAHSEHNAALVALLAQHGAPMPEAAWLSAVRSTDSSYLVALVEAGLAPPPAALELAIRRDDPKATLLLLPVCAVDVPTLRRLRRVAWTRGAEEPLRQALTRRIRGTREGSPPAEPPQPLDL